MDSDTNDAGGQQRHTSYALSEEKRRKSFEIEDERWTRGQQLRDWVLLLIIALLNVGWMWLVYLVEPGLR